MSNFTFTNDVHITMDFKKYCSFHVSKCTYEHFLCVLLCMMLSMIYWLYVCVKLYQLCSCLFCCGVFMYDFL